MTIRQSLPLRRSLETISIEADGAQFSIGLGRAIEDTAMGPILEVFINGQKPNSMIDALVSDGGILMSLLLQYGCPAARIRHALRRNPDDTPASVLGHAADFVIMDEIESP